MVSQEVIVQRGKIGPASRHKLQGSFNVQAEGVGTLNHIQNVFRPGLDNSLLLGEVADHRRCAIQLGGGGDIDQGRIGGQGRRSWVSQKALVHVFQRHGGFEWINMSETNVRVEGVLGWGKGRTKHGQRVSSRDGWMWMFDDRPRESERKGKPPVADWREPRL